MNNNDKAWLWGCQDFSEGELLEEKLAIRLRNVEEATAFKSQFEAAQVFNQKAKAGDTDIVMAEVVENIVEEVDDCEENVTAEEKKSWTC